ncbi:hypothetical protein FACS1894208_07640 [Clostridia bacterium]|nr:hypothetical protein FACS1894208_07640 [Clostridia bacterium]
MNKLKLPLDIVLLLLFGALCNTQVTGVEFHEPAGILYSVLIVVHLVINRKWLTAAFKGKLRGKRAGVLATVNIGLFVVFMVILITGIRSSRDIFPADVKAPEYFLAVHAACSIVTAFLVLAHVLLHWNIITKKKPLRKAGLAIVLIVVIGYSLFGSVQGTLKWTLDKDNNPGFEQYDSTNDETSRRFTAANTYGAPN